MAEPHWRISPAGGATLAASPPARAEWLAHLAGLRADALGLAGIAVQLAMVAAVVVALRIESPAFYGKVVPLAFGGAVVHHLLPARWRLGAFALLSLAAIWLVFGIPAGTALIGLGLALIICCHLPAPFAVRVGCLVALAAVLAAARVGWGPLESLPLTRAVWPVLGSMFMFRLIVYLYDLRHAKVPTTWAERLAYFFCLPNVAFPLFPVVDFATFRRTYYDRPAVAIYQEGVQWIVRGLVHLVVYRLVYQQFTLAPTEVTTGSQLVQYLVANYALYLRVSGQFHLIVGLLHLFGFRLPETHRFFYLASSFSDLWRRINIYWKDFMQKLFYLPVFFPLQRRLGERAAMVGATLVVFTATWLLHSYQWFWILGTWLWSGPDTLFWGVLAACLVANQLWESRASSRHRAPAAVLGGRVAALAGWALVRHGARTSLMFATMSVLWGVWTAATFSEVAALARAPRWEWSDVAVALGVLAVVALIAMAAYRPAHTPRGTPAPRVRPGTAPTYRDSSEPDGTVTLPGRILRVLRIAAMNGQVPRLSTFAAFGFLAVVGAGTRGPVTLALPHDVVAALRDARSAPLNRRDQEELQRGYYEQLVGVNRANGELWRLYAARPTEWPGLKALGGVRDVPGGRTEELVPNFSLNFRGAPFTTNRWGMRDRDYPLQKPPGVRRVAILGQSYVMGSGVGDGETFEALVEDRLARDPIPALGGTRVELLNFAVPSYSLLQQRALIEHGTIQRFAPDVLMLIGHRSEYRLVADYIMQILRRPTDTLPTPVAELVRRTGVTAELGLDAIHRRIGAGRVEVLRWVLREIHASALAMGATPVMVYVPTPMEGEQAQLGADLMALAREAGYAVVDLSDVYDEVDERDVIVAEWDRHPNRKGHALIARRLEEALRRSPELLEPPIHPATRRLQQ